MREFASSVLIDVMLMMITTSSGAVSNDDDDDVDDEASVKCEKIPSELASCPHLINERLRSSH